VRAWAVFKREYLQAVRRKSFVIMTVVAPFLMLAMMLVPAVLMTRGVGDKRVLLIDGTGRVARAFEAELPLVPADGSDERTDDAPASLSTSMRVEAITTADPDLALAASLARMAPEHDADDRLDGVLVLPRDLVESPRARAAYYARASTDFQVQRRLERAVNRAVVRERWRARGMGDADLDLLGQRVTVETVRVSKDGHRHGGGELDYVIGFAFVALLFVPILLYGQTIMLGIVQEKNDRVVEVLLSSLSAMELLSGKVLGLAAVGLTQVTVWMTMATSLASMAPATQTMDVSRFFRAGVFAYFVVFFLLGYLIQVCVYAMGGAIANSEREARQIIMPAAMAMMIPWFLVMPVLTNPDSPLSTVLSLIPIFTPITMFMRVLVSDPPLWQVAGSIAMTTATVWALFRLAAKVFRIGILSYGRRPTLAELWAWVRHA
jgi:ABC-2 type transport system permease protein